MKMGCPERIGGRDMNDRLDTETREELITSVLDDGIKND